MKKKSKLFGIAILLAIGCALVGLLEVFDLHPEFSIGKFHSVWAGVRHMDFVSGKTVLVRGGKKVIQRNYDVGPVKITIGA